METPFVRFSKQDVELIQREVLHQSVFCLARYELRHRLFNGEWSTRFSREILERKSAVAVLPYDPLLDKVVLIQQFRAGAIGSLHVATPWLIETVAGVYDENETPSQVALRESEEEAGCKILDLCLICDYFASPGGCNEHLFLFCGHINAAQVGGIHGLAEEHEDIRAFALPFDEAYALIEQGKIKTSPAIISLQWLLLNRERLRQQWQTTK